jgi:cytochrome c556
LKIEVVGIALLLLAGCGSSGDGGATLAEANASGNAASAAIETTVLQSHGTPLEKGKALALMKQRHKDYEKIGAAMKVVGRELKSESPNLAVVRTEAATIAELASQVPSWFPTGTGPDVGKTEARAEIWQKPEDFAAKVQTFRAAAEAFNADAKGTDLGAIRSAHSELGKSCKGCHDLYREEHSTWFDRSSASSLSRTLYCKATRAADDLCNAQPER